MLCFIKKDGEIVICVCVWYWSARDGGHDAVGALAADHDADCDKEDGSCFPVRLEQES